MLVFLLILWVQACVGDVGDRTFAVVPKNSLQLGKLYHSASDLENAGTVVRYVRLHDVLEACILTAHVVGPEGDAMDIHAVYAPPDSRPEIF